MRSWSFFTLLLGTFKIATASPIDPDPSQPLRLVIQSCTVPNTAALTFDDGPYLYLEDISNTLSAAGARGTFFLNGNNWGCIYDNITQIQDAYSKGHQLGSHTWTHPDMATLDWDGLNNEMWLSEQAIQRITGAYPAFTRPPYGSYNDLVIQVADTRNQTLVTWDFDSGDSVGKTAEESMQLYDELVSDHPNSILALNHEVYETTAHTVLPHAIQVLQQAGYQLVTLAECLNVQPYLLTGQPAADGPWTC